MRGVQPVPEQEEEKPNFIADTLMGVPRGIEGAVQSIYDLADFATGDILPDYDTRFLGRSKRFGGTMTEGITQFLTGFIPVAGQISKIGKLSKLNKVGKRVLNLKGAATAGAVADFTMFQAQEERLSNLIETFPSLSNPVTDFLAADDDDGEIEGRLKNTVEGLGIGGVVDSLLGGLKALKRSRKGDEPESIINDFYDSYNQQKNDDLLRADYAETTSFRETIDKAFQAKFGNSITEEGTVVNAFDTLKTFDEGYTGEFKPLITALLDKASVSLKNTEVLFENAKRTDTGEELGSKYRDGQILMRTGGERTFVHEVLHAVTVKQLDTSFEAIVKKLNLKNPDNLGASRLVASNRPALELLAKNKEFDPIAGMADTYLKVIKALGQDEGVFGRTAEQIKEAKVTDRNTPYGLTNIEEFISEAFTNPEFRKILAELPSETASRSMFDEVMDSIRRMLGLDKSQGSVLGDVFKYTDDIVQKQNAEYADTFDYLESFDELTGRIQRGTKDKPTGRGDDYYDDLYENSGFAQDRTLDNRTGDFRKTETIGKMSPLTLRENPDKVYLFGDNLEGVGKGGQAVVRGEPNAIGIPTKKGPKSDEGAYFNDADLKANKEAIDAAFNKIPDEATVVIPKDGLGKDLANKAPKTFEYLKEKLDELQSSSVRDGMQKDDMIPERGRTLEPFKIEFGKPFKGKDISEVPDSYLRKSLEFDSIPDKTKTRINEELEAREGGEAPRMGNDFVPEKDNLSKQLGGIGKLKAARLMSERGRAEIDSPLTKDEIFSPKTKTAREMYMNYRKARGGGKANARDLSFKEYMESRSITHNTVLNKRGKVVGSKETVEFTSAKFRKEARKFKEEGGFGQDSLDDFAKAESDYRAGKINFMDYMKRVVGDEPDDVKYATDREAEATYKQAEEEAKAKELEMDEDTVAYKNGDIDAMEYFRRIADDSDDTESFIREGVASEKAKELKMDEDELAYKNGEIDAMEYNRRIADDSDSGGFGQDSIDDFIEDRITQTSREIGDANTTGGARAILNMAKNIRTSKHALALMSGIARNLNETGAKQKVTKEELAAETEEMASILGGDKNTWLSAVRGLSENIPDLQKFRDAQRGAKTLMDIMSRDIVDTARKAVQARTSDTLNLQKLETEFISKLDQLTEVQRIYSLMGREAGLTLLQRNFLGNAKGKYRLNDNVGFDFVAGDQASYARYTTQSVGGKNVKEAIDDFTMYGSDKQVQDGVASAAGDELTTSVVKGAKGMFGSKLMRMTTEYWINSLLSGPTTQLVNTLGSGLTTAIRMGELAMGSVMAGDSSTRRAIFQYAFNMESITEAFKFAGKAWRINDSVLVQGSRQFDDQLRRNEMITGENAMEAMGKGAKALGGAQDAVSGAIDFIGKAVRLPSRGLMTVDELFKQLNYRTYVRTNLAMEALNKNADLTGKELAKIVGEDFEKYVTDGGRAYNEGNLYLDAVEKVKGDGIDYGVDQAAMVQNEIGRNPFDPSRSALANSAKNYAEVNTFTNELDNDSVVGKVGNMLGNAKQELGGLNFIIPFVRTPTNILQFSLDRTPLGLAKTLKETMFRKEELTTGLGSKNPMEQALARGKIATGVAFSSAMLWYAMSNKEFITGHGPQNKDEKDALKASGWQPYSFRIPNGKGGHNYWSYQRLDPVATIIGLFADMAEFEDYHEMDGPALKDLFAMTALSFTQNVTNKSYVKGLDTLLNAFKDPVNNAQGVAGNIAGGFMPSFAMQMQNAGGDRTLRETRTVFDYFVARSPASGILPARRNFLGEASIVKNPKLFGAINPVYFSPESKDPVDQELKTLLHGFSKPNSKLMGAIQLKDIYNEDGRQAYDVWLEKTSTTKIGGKTLRQYLHKMVKSKEYQALPAQSQSDIGEKSPRIKAINSWLRAFRGQAKQEMIEEFPELQTSLNDLQQQKQQYRLMQ